MRTNKISKLCLKGGKEQMVLVDSSEEKERGERLLDSGRNQFRIISKENNERYAELSEPSLCHRDYSG